MFFCFMVVNSDGADGVDGVDGSVSGGVIPWQTGRLLQSSVYRVLSLISFLLRPPISVSGGGLSQDKVLLSCARETERERERAARGTGRTWVEAGGVLASTINSDLSLCAGPWTRPDLK